MSRYEQLSVGELTSTRESIVTFGVGAKEGGTAAIKNAYKVTERGTDVVHKTVFTFNDTPLTFLDTGTGVGFKIYTFPVGRIVRHGAAGSMAITTTSVLASTLNAAAGLFWGAGSVTQAGGTTLATTEQDFVQTTAAVASATIDVAGASAAGVGVPSVTPFAGVSTATALFLNYCADTATEIDANATVTINGTVNIYWSNLV